jgi:UPF0271 protein
MDLNCDVGEGAGADAELMPLITSANIACGAHAGDPQTMASTLALARMEGVVAGAHPGYPDRENFGRRELNLEPAELTRSLVEQLTALREAGEYAYVKPHGALYNQAARDEALAHVVVRVVKDFDENLGLLAQAGSALARVGEEAGLRVAAEAFADRAYDATGRLVPRSQPGALITDEEQAVEQVLEMTLHGRVRALSGEWVPVQADSICVHGDNPRAVAFVRRLRQALVGEGVQIQSCWRDS